MRIAIAAHNYPPLVNGSSTFTRDLAVGLAGRGHEVLVTCPSARPHHSGSVHGSLRVERLAGIPLNRHGPRIGLAIRPGPRLHRILDEFQPEVVHLQDHFPLCRSMLGEAARRGVPVVATNHFLPSNFTAYAPLPRPLRSLADDVLWRTAGGVFRNVQAVTSPTQTALGLLCKYDLACEGEAISCGVDVERFQPLAPAERRAAREALGLPRDALLVLYVGRLEPEKRVTDLVRALARCKNRELRLVLAGQGGRAAELVRLAGRLGLGSRVRLLGYVPDDRLPALFGAADLFAMPSEAELQSIASLQALAAGLPLVVADAVALPELVPGQENGRLFPTGDVAELARQLDTVSSDPVERRRMSRASRAIAERHDRRLTIERYEALYERVRQLSVRPAAA